MLKRISVLVLTLALAAISGFAEKQGPFPDPSGGTGNVKQGPFPDPSGGTGNVK